MSASKEICMPSSFNAVQSTEVAILGIVGGIGITHGPLLAALFMVSIRELLTRPTGWRDGRAIHGDICGCLDPDRHFPAGWICRDIGEYI